MVKVKLHLHLAKYGEMGNKEFTINYEENMTLESLLKKLRIPEEEVGMFVVNGKWQDKNYIILDQDSIEIFPVYLGG